MCSFGHRRVAHTRLGVCYNSDTYIEYGAADRHVAVWRGEQAQFLVNISAAMDNAE